MYRHLCVLMSACVCLYVGLWAQQPDWAEAWVPSEEEEEGRRGARNRWGMGALPNHHYPHYPAWVRRLGGGGVKVGATVAARQWEWHLFTATPSSLQLLRFVCLNLSLPSTSVAFLLLLLLPSRQRGGEARHSRPGAVSRTGPDVVTCEEREGFVRTQTQTQTITVTSAYCLSATKAAVKWNDRYKMACVSRLA